MRRSPSSAITPRGPLLSTSLPRTTARLVVPGFFRGYEKEKTSLISMDSMDSVVRAFFGNMLTPVIQNRISKRKFRSTFLNGKQIEVEYIYDWRKRGDERLKINIHLLLPIFGGVKLPIRRKFLTLPDVEAALKIRRGLHLCEDGIYTPCSNLDAELRVEEDTCPFQHFHHYCPIHVNAWFEWYLHGAIVLQEKDYTGLIKFDNLLSVIRLPEGVKNINNPDFWLLMAQLNGCGCSRKMSPNQQGPLSTNIFPATFLNGKHIELEYNYDQTRPRDERVQIRLQALSPILGETMSSGARPFVSVLDVEDVLKSSPGLHQCGDGIYTPCSNLAAELQVEEDTCSFQHFHHYCPIHVNAWFKWYLPKAIALREEDYDVLVKNEDSQNPDRMMTGDRFTPEFWLHLAQQNGCGCSRKISPKQEGPLSTNIFPATFLNGKQIDVEYNYDRTRPREQRVQISIQGLLPVFGGSMPPDGRRFVSVFDVEDILKSSPGLHQCGDGIYTPCSNLDAELQVEENTCPFQHFHHYCPIHVNAWFKWYLPRVITLREGDFPELVTLEDSQYNFRMMTPDRFVPEFWLSFAQQHGCGCSRKISSK